MGDLDQVSHVAAEALSAFGSFDTWVNNAAISIYGKFEDVPVEDLRRLGQDTGFELVAIGRIGWVRAGKPIAILAKAADAPERRPKQPHRSAA